MGLAPAAIRGMTMAEFAAVMEGFAQFHSGHDPGEANELTDEFKKALADEALAGRL